MHPLAVYVFISDGQCICGRPKIFSVIPLPDEQSRVAQLINVIRQKNSTVAWMRILIFPSIFWHSGHLETSRNMRGTVASASLPAEEPGTRCPPSACELRRPPRMVLFHHRLRRLRVFVRVRREICGHWK